MQSIYFFRDADAELFPRVEKLGLEIPGDLPLLFDSVHLTANFRSAAARREHQRNFRSGLLSTTAAASTFAAGRNPRVKILLQSGPHSSPRDLRRACSFICEFIPASRANSKARIPIEKRSRSNSARPRAKANRRNRRARFATICPNGERRAAKRKYRIAVLGRARKSLVPIAKALARRHSSPFVPSNLSRCKDRPEIIDALALPARSSIRKIASRGWACFALHGAASRSPICTHCQRRRPELLARPVPELLSERMQLISVEGREAVDRVLRRQFCRSPALVATHVRTRHLARAGLAATGRRAVRRRRWRAPISIYCGAASTPSRRASPISSARARCGPRRSQSPARSRRGQRLRRAADDHPQGQGPGIRGRDRARSAGRRRGS
jgi:ATP-dependent helicase/nuclease subunit A